MDPFSLRGAWLAGHSARLRMSPMTALTRGHLEGGCISRTMVGRPPCRRTAFWDTSHSGCLNNKYIKVYILIIENRINAIQKGDIKKSFEQQVEYYLDKREDC